MIKTNNQNTIKTRQKFDQTFKREAVNNWLNSGKSARVVAVELGILPNRLYAWQQRFAPAAAGGNRPPCWAAARNCGQSPGSTTDFDV
jgi:transposase-like protein